MVIYLQGHTLERAEGRPFSPPAVRCQENNVRINESEGGGEDRKDIKGIARERERDAAAAIFFPDSAWIDHVRLPGRKEGRKEGCTELLADNQTQGNDDEHIVRVQ